MMKVMKVTQNSSNAIDANLTHFLPITVPETEVISGVIDDKGDESFLPIADPETVTSLPPRKRKKPDYYNR